MKPELNSGQQLLTNTKRPFKTVLAKKAVQFSTLCPQRPSTSSSYSLSAFASWSRPSFSLSIRARSLTTCMRTLCFSRSKCSSRGKKTGKFTSAWPFWCALTRSWTIRTWGRKCASCGTIRRKTSGLRMNSAAAVVIPPPRERRNRRRECLKVPSRWRKKWPVS